MPFNVRKTKGGYVVTSPHRVLGRHKSKRKAMAQLRAVYANYGKR